MRACRWSQQVAASSCVGSRCIGPSGVVAHTLCAHAPLAVWQPSGDTSVVYECGVNQR